MRRFVFVGLAMLVAASSFALAARHSFQASQATSAPKSRGLTLYEEGKYAEAAEALAQESAAKPEDEKTLVLLGISRARAGNGQAALEPLNKVVAKNPNNAEAHFGLGLAYAKLQQIDKSIAELEAAWKLNAEHAYTHYYLGMAYNQKGKKDLSIPHLKRFLELAPNAPEAPAVKSYLSRI